MNQCLWKVKTLGDLFSPMDFLTMCVNMCVYNDLIKPDDFLLLLTPPPLVRLFVRWVATDCHWQNLVLPLYPVGVSRHNRQSPQVVWEGCITCYRTCEWDGFQPSAVGLGITTCFADCQWFQGVFSAWVFRPRPRSSCFDDFQFLTLAAEWQIQVGHLPGICKTSNRPPHVRHQ